MRISDWSSDVCSSDLPAIARALARFPPDVLSDEALREKLARVAIASDFAIAVLARQPDLLARLAADDGAAPPTAPLLDADHRGLAAGQLPLLAQRSEEHTSELQSLMRISYAVFCLQKKTQTLHNKMQYNNK